MGKSSWIKKHWLSIISVTVAVIADGWPFAKDAMGFFRSQVAAPQLDARYVRINPHVTKHKTERATHVQEHVGIALGVKEMNKKQDWHGDRITVLEVYKVTMEEDIAEVKVGIATILSRLP